jgi:SAM-dependent methyltransferase
MSMTSQTKFLFGHVAFFGRGIDEYRSMFNLQLDQLSGKSILDCGAGPAAFALQAAQLGATVTAVDPLYSLPCEVLRETVDEDTAAVTVKQSNNTAFICDDVVPTSERRKAMELFLQDFESGKQSGRYVSANLPRLPFEDRSFELVLSGNFLFEYSDTESGGMLVGSPFDYQFHIRAIAELLRVCRNELRIYPLLAPGNSEHKYLDRIVAEFQSKGFDVGLDGVTHRDIVGADKMLRIAINNNN